MCVKTCLYVRMYLTVLVSIRTCWSVSIHGGVGHDVSKCVRMCRCVSGPGVYQDVLMCFRTCWCVSEHVDVFQNMLVSVRTYCCLSGCVTVCQNMFAGVASRVRVSQRCSGRVNGCQNMKSCVMSDRAVVSQTLSLPIWTYRHPPRCPRCTENHRYHRRQDQSCPSMHC